jgi:hypothetical protein
MAASSRDGRGAVCGTVAIHVGDHANGPESWAGLRSRAAQTAAGSSSLVQYMHLVAEMGMPVDSH